MKCSQKYSVCMPHPKRRGNNIHDSPIYSMLHTVYLSKRVNVLNATYSAYVCTQYVDDGVESERGWVQGT